MDQVPGYQNDKLTENGKHWLYISTFPSSWASIFDLHKNIDDTSFNEIDNFMRKQKDEADKKKKQSDNKKKKEEEDKKRNPHQQLK